MRRPRHLLLPGLLLSLLALAHCRKPEPEKPAAVDCGEDFNCILERAPGCQPASALLRQQYTVEGKPLQVLARYEVVGRVRGRCHVRRTQIDPPPPPPTPDAGAEEEPYEEYEYLWKKPVPVPIFGPRPREMLPPQMQCLYPEDRVMEALWRAQHDRSTQPELDPCYPGDGSCAQTPIPVLAPGCVLEDCLLGRWTFTCESMNGSPRRTTIHSCEGTRLSDENPGCALLCKHGKHELSCRGPLGPAPGWEPIILMARDELARLPPEKQEELKKREAELIQKREDYRLGRKRERSFKLEDLPPEMQARIKALDAEIAREEREAAQKHKAQEHR